MTEYEKKRLELEETKVKHLGKLATCVDILTLWFEEIDKEEWGERMQFYLAEFLNRTPEVPKEEEEETAAEEGPEDVDYSKMSVNELKEMLKEKDPVMF